MSKVKNIKPKVIQDSEQEDSSVPIIAAKPSKKLQVQEKKAIKKPAKQESSEEEETPIVQKKPVKQLKTQSVPVKKVVQVKKVVKPQSSEQEESEEQKPKKIVAKVKSPAQKAIVPKKQQVEESEEQESQEAPKPKAKVAKIVQKVTSPVQKAKSPQQKPVVQKKQESSSEQSEEQVKPTKKFAAKPSKVVAKKESSSEQSEQEKPVKKVVAKKAVKKVQPEESEQQKPVAKVAPKKAVVQEKIVDQDQEGVFQVCVKGLSFQAYDSDIRDFFNECGNVSEVKLLTREDGKSRGLAFVKFSKKSSFNKAIELNGSQHLGRSLTIQQSQGKKNNGGNAFGNNSRGGYNDAKGGFKPQGEANIENPTLFIGGLSYNSTVESIKEFFQPIGNVSSARIVTDRQTGKPRGFGYVEFYDLDTAKKAYKELNGGELDGRQIRLDSASQREKPAGGFQQREGGYQQNGGYQQRDGGFGGRGAPRNQGNSTVVLSQDDKNAKKGAIGSFAGKKIVL